jgi:hypothetical protein
MPVQQVPPTARSLQAQEISSYHVPNNDISSNLSDQATLSDQKYKTN